MRIVLASQSPRRRELFSLITDQFSCAVAPVDERSVQEKDARLLCLALARLKSHAVATTEPDAVIIGCDTVVEAAGRILGKPKEQAEARNMIRLLSGGTHEVYTGVCIRFPDDEAAFTVRTSVHLFPIPEEEVERYILTPEPYDKAGGYGIQGWMSRWLDRIEGDYFNVIGLPVSRIYAQLKLKKFV